VDIQSTCETVFDLKQKIDRFNSSVGFITIVKVFVNGIYLSSGLCGLAGNFSSESVKDLNAVTAIVCYCLSSLLDIIVGCCSSQGVIDSMNSLCHEIELKLVVKRLTYDQYRQLKVVLGMRKTIKFKCMGLFDLKSVTILVIISYVVNYAVILIQTQ